MGNNTINKSVIIPLLYKACTSDGDKKNLEILFKNHLNFSMSLNSTAPQDNTDDHGAVLYIVAVLVFYSLGIVIMIIKYSKSEKKEMEEEAALEVFFKGLPLGKTQHEHSVNTVAIKAFHTLTLKSYENHRNKTSNNHVNAQPKALLETDL